MLIIRKKPRKVVNPSPRPLNSSVTARSQLESTFARLGNHSTAWAPSPGVAVGTPVAQRPPRGSVLAELPHTALTADAWHRSAKGDRDEESLGRGATGPQNAPGAPTYSRSADCDVESHAASACVPRTESSEDWRDCREPRDS